MYNKIGNFRDMSKAGQGKFRLCRKREMKLERKSYKNRDVIHMALFWLVILGIFMLGIVMNQLCEPLPVFEGTESFQEDGWAFSERGETPVPAFLGDRYMLEPKTVYVLQAKLTYDGSGDPFPSAFISIGNLEIEVYVDGESVFRNSHAEKVFKKVQSVGKSCISIPLGKNCGGKDLTIELRNPMNHPVYQKLPAVTFGDSETQTRRALLQSVPSMLVSASILFAVIILVILGNTVDGTQWTYVYFSVFGICVVVYQSMQNMFILYVWAKPFMALLCEYLAIAVCPIPLIMSYRYRVKPYYQKTFDLLAIGTFINLILQLTLHFNGIRDLTDMRIISSLWDIFVAGFMFHIGLSVRRATGQKKILRKIVPIFIGSFCEILYFYSSKFFRFSLLNLSQGDFIGIAMLISMLLMILEARHARIHGIQEEERNQILERVAFTDALTGIGNRAAITKELEKLSASGDRKKKLLIVSADLNYLKKTNDNLGHEAGDDLIIRAANFLKKEFSPWGLVYRTGGDEFFAVLWDVTEEDWPQIQKEMEENLNKANQDASVVLSLALGAANMDLNHISQSIRLSDERMYAHKVQQHELLKQNS